MRLGAAGLGATQAVAAWAKESDAEIMEAATSDMEDLTYQDEVGTVQRGKHLADTRLLYTTDAADELLCGELGGTRTIKKKKHKNTTTQSQQ